MTIKTRILSAILAIGLIPLLVTSISSYLLTSNNLTEALTQETGERLTAMREEKREALRIYLDNLNRLIRNTGRSSSIIEATDEFSAEFERSLRREQRFERANTSPKLVQYYENDFGSRFYQYNPGLPKTTVSGYFQQLDEGTGFYQSRYIAENPNPLGAKDELNSAADAGMNRIGYDVAHARYHSEFRELTQEYGFYDLFLIDNDGRVVYSVFKETDYATSLETGPFRDSLLADAWRSTQQAEPLDVLMTDFKRYAPSYNSPASFMSTPVFKGEQRIGSLIVQLSVQQFTDILTSKNRWEEVGMGETGEVFLVGPDNTLRTDSRAFLNDPAVFIGDQLAKGQLSNAEAGLVLSHQTSVGVVKTVAPSINDALEGKTGVAVSNNYLGVKSLIAYSPLELQGLKWAIVAQISHDEAFESLHSLKTSLITITSTLVAVAAGVALLFGLYVASKLVTPIRELVDTLTDIAEGEGDLTIQLASAKRRDEIGELSTAFNTFVGKIRSVVSDVAVAANQLSGVSNEFARATEEGRLHISRQRDMAQSIASAMTEFAASIDEVARTSNETLDTMNRANKLSHSGGDLALRSRNEIERLSQGTQESADAISQLSQEIDQIKEVLNVINGIAEQTSLLALNAAIEAARAGEQGRGFAVVADEVRQLSSRTQAATVEIASKIERLRNSADESVTRVQHSLAAAQTGIELSNQTNDGLQEISSLVGEVNGMQSQVASAVVQQQSVVKDIESSIIDIDQLSEVSFEESSKTQSRAGELLQMAEGLQQLVNRFKV